MHRVANFDGLVGPNHNYAGLSHGNVASTRHGGEASNPRAAVLQGLDKMAEVASLGFVQGFLPPLARPRLDVLARFGFEGEGALDRAGREAPPLLAACFSASAMWTANAATVTGSGESEDGRVHFTPANLSSKLHRSLEGDETGHALRRIFAGERFAHHAPLPFALGDEGAANHARLVGQDVFVWGRALTRSVERPTRFDARQALEASETIARVHGVRAPIFVQQSPRAIDAGVFHNDVVSVGEGDLLLHHEDAWVCAPSTVLQGVRVASVSRDELSLEDAVETYLFNGQLLESAQGFVLLAPQECSEHGATRAVIDRWLAEGVLADVRFKDLHQSMRNGGGPACLRLRVPLTENEVKGVLSGCLWSEEQDARLRAWAQKHYRESLAPADLRDPALVRECHEALDALTQLTGLGDDFYAFQRA